MKLGIFFGSFNPVHKGHIKIVNYIIENNIVDKVLIIPTLNYWDKNDLIDLKYRIDMLKYFENDKITVLEKFNDLIYTIDLVNALKKEYNDTLYLIMGADNIVSFDKWKNYKELLNYNMIIYKRNNIDIKHYLDCLGKKDKYIIIDSVKNINISSTKIRKNINNKNELKKYLDERIIDYINKNNLYS